MNADDSLQGMRVTDEFDEYDTDVNHMPWPTKSIQISDALNSTLHHRHQNIFCKNGVQ